MKTVSKIFETIKAAEAHQNRLYNQYNSVQLICCPIFGESGVYIWQCNN
jgi:hypothetical protein